MCSAYSISNNWCINDVFVGFIIELGGCPDGCSLCIMDLLIIHITIYLFGY